MRLQASRRQGTKSTFVGACLVVSCCLAAPALGQVRLPPPRPNQYVHDLANVISTADANKMERVHHELFLKTEVTIAVIAIRTLRGENIAEFNRRIANEWGLGTAATSRGIVVSLAVQENQLQISTGRGLNVTDSEVDAVLDHASPILRRNTSEGLLAISDGLVSRCAAAFGVTVEGSAAHRSRPVPGGGLLVPLSPNSGVRLLTILLMSLGILYLTVRVLQVFGYNRFTEFLARAMPKTQREAVGPVAFLADRLSALWSADARRRAEAPNPRLGRSEGVASVQPENHIDSMVNSHTSWMLRRSSLFRFSAWAFVLLFFLCLSLMLLVAKAPALTTGLFGVMSLCVACTGLCLMLTAVHYTRAHDRWPQLGSLEPSSDMLIPLSPKWREAKRTFAGYPELSDALEAMTFAYGFGGLACMMILILVLSGDVPSAVETQRELG